MDEPKTFPEMLDAAASPAGSDDEFGGLLMGMFSTLDRLRLEDEG